MLIDKAWKKKSEIVQKTQGITYFPQFFAANLT